jgi:hypothetical protein
MRPTLKWCAALTAYFTLIVAVALTADHRGFAFNQSGPNLNTLEGQPTCAGPPSAGNVLGFRSGTWCDTNSVPAMFATYIAGTNGITSATHLSRWISSGALHLVRLDVRSLGVAVGCTTPAVVEINSAGADLADSQITLTNAFTVGTVVANDAVAAGVNEDVEIQTGALGCTTFPSSISVVATYTAG